MKKGITIKITRKEFESSDEYSKIKEFLKKNQNNAYTRMGIMIELFGVKQKDIDGKNFSDWPRGTPTLYTHIRKALERLEKEGLILSKKKGKAYYVIWRK